MDKQIYDVIIIGAGAAGMTASIYCSRYKLDHLIFGEKIGGQFIDAVAIENYPGFTSISGSDLAQAFKEHVGSYGVTIRGERVIKAMHEGSAFTVVAEAGDAFRARSLILTMGSKHRRLGVPGEEEFSGRGVSYCATCDAPLLKGKTVAVVGGGNSALTAAIHLASFAKKVYLIHRRDEYRATPIWVERLRVSKNIEEVLSRQVTEIKGEKSVGSVALDQPYKGKEMLAVDGVFVEIGFDPSAALAEALGVGLDDEGFIRIGADCSTGFPGVFAAGDIAQIPGGVPLKQIVNSAGQGAEAATSAYNYICQLETCEREE